MNLKSNPQHVENFGRNVVSRPRVCCSPRSEQEVLDFLAENDGQSIRVVASGHAWSDGIQTAGGLLSLDQLTSIEVDENSKTVRVGAGCQIKHLLKELSAHELTLPSVGLIDEQTVAGATATGTHGSGKHSLSHYITAVRIAHYDSETGHPTITRIESGPDLLAARCSLGMLGVIIEIEFECRDRYNIREHVALHKSLESLLRAEPESPLQQFFLIPWSWQLYGQHRAESSKPRSRLAGLYRVYWHLGIDWGLHLIVVSMVRVLKMRWLIRFFYRWILPLTLARNWTVIDDSHRMLVMEHELFRHIEIEMFVQRSDLRPALEFVRESVTVFGGGSTKQSMEILTPFAGTYFHHYPICVRRVQSDDTLISMSSPTSSTDREDWYAISFISYEKPDRRDGYFRFAGFLAAEMRDRFGARPHWGKYNPLTRTENDPLYFRLDEFRDIAARYDNRGIFRNEWLNNAIGSA